MGESTDIKKPTTRFLKRRTLRSDQHSFIGRVYDLSIVGLNFESDEDAEKFPDCWYALQTCDVVSGLAQRVESLNMVGDMLWPDPMPNFTLLPITQFDWLTVVTDAFLMRYISVVDCSLLLVNCIYRYGLSARQCTFDKLKRSGLPEALSNHLQSMLDSQEALRFERNARIHHGSERAFTEDDMTFRMASRYPVKGKNLAGRLINADRSFKEGLVGLQRDFNRSTRELLVQLDRLYDLSCEEFETNFGALIAAATHGFNVQRPAR